MAVRRHIRAPFPSKEEILRYVHANPDRAGKRDIVRAFGLDRAQASMLGSALANLAEEGVLVRGRHRAAKVGRLPRVAVVEVTGTDTDGEVLARPVTWPPNRPFPVIYMAPERRGHPALGPGDRVLARLRAAGDGTYEGRTISRIAAAPPMALGVYDVVDGQGRLRPAGRRQRGDILIARADSLGARIGELVQAELLPGRRLGLRQARVVERLGARDHPASVSLIAIHDHGLPIAFSAEALAAAAAAGPAPNEGREDLRQTPLVTIDGTDARDFDDAVWAEPEGDAAAAGGWHLLVAIADVAWYVRPGDALDTAAYERGNSAYFPDRVVPMLPEELSNGWCSLKPGEDRPCLAVHLWIGADGRLRRHRFGRAVMRSAARLTYEQIQAARDGNPDAIPAELAKRAVQPLYGAYAALARARRARSALELDLPERRVVLGDDGAVVRIEPEPRYDSHRLIEEFMITANVAAAETLEARHQPVMYRVHDAPATEKLDAFRDFLDTLGLGLRLSRGQAITPMHFNHILERARGTVHERMVSEVILRTQAQAAYAPRNIGHFGLALPRYCHFTSPIRRYADLLVHRALIRGHRLGAGALGDEHGDFDRVGTHISETERRAMAAERDTLDRYAAAYLAERVGAIFTGTITGVTRFGLFVSLEEGGADGLVPLRRLPPDTYIHDPRRHELRGRDRNRRFRLGDEVTVRLTEADPISGGLVLDLVHLGIAAPSCGRQPEGRRRRGQESARARPGDKQQNP